MIDDTPAVALVQDALPYIGGAERVLESVLDVYPAAPIFTLVYNRENFRGTSFFDREVHTSFLNRFPRAKTAYRSYLPLFPLAIEQFNLRGFELILSFSYAAAHGILPRPEQLHLSYIYTPIRQAWHFYYEFLREAGLENKLTGWAAKAVLHYIRLWDFSAAGRVDHFIAPSRWTADCVWRVYHRRASVIYPPVDVERFKPSAARGDYYVVVSRLVQHKKIDLIVDAFSRLRLPLVVVGDGPERERISERASTNIQMMGRLPDSAVKDLLENARAFIHAAEDDFGIAPVEAQAAGCPVIAYGSGGILETVVEGKTGLFFAHQRADCLAAAVERFEQGEISFKAEEIRRNAERFNKQRFQRELGCLVERRWERWKQGWKGRVSM